MADNELILQGGAMSARTVSEALSPEIEAILTDASSAEAAADLIVANPDLLAQARACVETVNRLTAPTPRNEVFRAYGPLFLIWDPKDFGKGKDAKALEDAWFDQHYLALKDLPLEAIELAIDRYRQVGKFPPTPANIYELAANEAAEIKMIAYRLRKVVEAGETRAVPERRPEDVEKVKAMMAEMRGANGKITLGRPAMRPMPVRDQHNMAEALRSLDKQG